MTKKKLKGKGEAEKAMLKINHIDSKLTGFVLQEEQAVAEARKKYYQGQFAARKAELEKEKKEAEKALERFAKADQENWEGLSVTTVGGVFGYRWSPHSVVLVKRVAKKMEDALLNLTVNYQRYVRRTSAINKALIIQDLILKKLDVAKLQDCGLDLVQKKGFYIKSNSAEALEKARVKLKKA